MRICTTIDKPVRRDENPVDSSWRMDWNIYQVEYLYRAVDKVDKTIEFQFLKYRDASESPYERPKKRHENARE